MCTYDQKSGSISITEIKRKDKSINTRWACFKNKNKNRERIHGISVDEGFFLGKKESLKLC